MRKIHFTAPRNRGQVEIIIRAKLGSADSSVYAHVYA